MKFIQRLWILIAVLGLFCLSFVGPASVSAHTMSPQSSTRTFWVQTLDSCRQAIPGAHYVLTGNGLNISKGPAPGTKPVKVGDGACLLQRGNCVKVPTGCLSWDIPIPSSGSKTYTITETSSPSGYAICVGGSACSIPETITLKINSAGTISATVRNVYPNGQSIVWPTSGAPYTGSSTNPAVTHNSRIGTGNCDSDQDLDDHTSGSEGNSPHCDNEKDRH